jgi:hypothetical protein
MLSSTQHIVSFTSLRASPKVFSDRGSSFSGATFLSGKMSRKARLSKVNSSVAEGRNETEGDSALSSSLETFLELHEVDLQGKTVLGTGCVFSKGGVHCSRSPKSIAHLALQATPSLSRRDSWYQSPWYLKNGHAQTIWGAKFRRSTTVEYTRELLPTPGSIILTSLPVRIVEGQHSLFLKYARKMTV